MAAEILRRVDLQDSVMLDEGQTVFAAWIYKCALIFDAANGNDGDLATLRDGFQPRRKPGPGA